MNTAVRASQELHIMLIEDQAVDQILIRRGLKQTPVSLTVQELRSAEAALRRLANVADGDLPDLIILDIGLPDASGLELLATLKAHTSWRRIPVVVLSGTLDAEISNQAYDIGAAAVIRKPDTLYALQDTVHRIAAVWGEAARPNA